MTDAPNEPSVFEVENIDGADSWVFGNDDVSIALTIEGAQMAPVQFYRRSDAPFLPYYVSPWTAEGFQGPAGEGIVDKMRGDVFCLPFGAPTSDADGAYSLHGDVTWKPWSFLGASRSGGMSTFSFAIEATNPSGQITKRVHLVDGQNIIYLQHEITGVQGSFPFGHHPMLRVGDDERVLIGTSELIAGRTWPWAFEDAASGGYSSMAVDVEFQTLDEVPSIFSAAPTNAVDEFPTPRGYTDGVVFVQEDIDGFCWTTATYTKEGYVWFSLKDPAMLPQTAVITMNRGRHYHPWDGREVLFALQDVRAYFNGGAVGSRGPNPFSDAGYPTTYEFSATKAVLVNHIQGVAQTPPNFGRVRSVSAGEGTLTLTDEAGTELVVAVAHSFLRDGSAALAGVGG